MQLSQPARRKPAVQVCGAGIIGIGSIFEAAYMPSAVAEDRTAAMGTAARSWRLNTASRLQTEPHTPLNDVQTVAD